MTDIYFQLLPNMNKADDGRIITLLYNTNNPNLQTVFKAIYHVHNLIGKLAINTDDK